MAKQTITDVQIKEFLKDFAEYSETEILEEGKEREDILEIASARGIELKNSKDLAGFKTIYTFADKANNNRARLPKEKLLKALPGMIGKPIDIDHNRRYVVGHYIDYKYHQKADMVVAYGVFYKSNFENEWEEAQRLFKEKKLGTSYEIWCPKDKRIANPDGTISLTEQEIAGGALIFKRKPAFPDAKVLEMAKDNMDKMEDQLVFASDKKYDEGDILFIASENVVTEQKAAVAPAAPAQPAEAVPPQPKPKAKCSNCGHEFDNTGMTGNVKCSECLAILDTTGTMLYPPQIIDFQVACSNCRSRNWLLLEKSEASAKIQCQSCAKKYSVYYETAPEISEDLTKLNFLFIGSTSCPQCGQYIGFSGTHKTAKYNLKCIKCGLSFSHDIAARENVKKITKVEEIVPKAEPVSASAIKSAEEKGEPKMALQRSKYHRYFEGESFDEFVKTLSDDYSDGIVVASKLTYEQKQNLKDSDFAVIVRIKNKKTGKTEKIRKYPIQDEAHVRNAMARLGQEAPMKELESLGVSVEAVRAKVLAKAKSLGMTEMVKEHEKPAEAAKEEVKPVETKVEEKKEPVVEQKPAEPNPVEQKVETPAPQAPVEAAKETPKPEEVPATVQPTAEVKTKETPKGEAPKETPKEEPKTEKPVTSARCKTAKKIKDLKKAAKESKKILEKASEDASKKVEFYKANALKIKTRRDELLEFASEMSDEDIVNDEKYTDAKVKKENTILENGAQTVGTKPKSDGHYKNLRDEIDRKAFGHLHQEKK